MISCASILWVQNHRAIMTDREPYNPIKAQFNPTKLHKENVYVCPGSANGERDLVILLSCILF